MMTRRWKRLTRRNRVSRWLSSADSDNISSAVDSTVGSIPPFAMPDRTHRMRTMISLFAWMVAALAAGLAPAADLLPADKSVEEAIDHYVEARLAQAAVSAAPQADDANLLRRTMLDLAGRIPTAAEAKAYVADQDVNKRTALVERLIASPAFVRQQAAEFDALLMRGTKGNLREYLAGAFKENRSWDKMFREMLLGQS